MPEPIATVGTAAIVAYLGKEGLNKLLGPTAEYLGEGLKNFTARRAQNINNIFNIAINKLGDKIEENGVVPPKILCAVISEGSFCDDELSAEYFGGVLASSRTSIQRDDRGVSLLATVNRLSSYQIRTHYIFYSIVKILFDGQNFKINMRDRAKMTVFVPTECYVDAMNFEAEELNKISVLTTHTLYGLVKENLIEDFRCGGIDSMRKFCNEAKSEGILFVPSIPGVELFLWAHGESDQSASYLLEADKQFKNQCSINIPEGYRPALNF